MQGAGKALGLGFQINPLPLCVKADAGPIPFVMNGRPAPWRTGSAACPHLPAMR